MRKIMKLLPVFGFVVGATLVLTTSAFTEVSGSDPDGMYTFAYKSGLPFDLTDVQERNNWAYNPNATGCDDAPEAACVIRVSASSVDSTVTPFALKSGVTISAQLNQPTNTAYVTSVSDQSATIINRQAN